MGECLAANSRPGSAKIPYTTHALARRITRANMGTMKKWPQFVPREKGLDVTLVHSTGRVLPGLLPDSATISSRSNRQSESIGMSVRCRKKRPGAHSNRQLE